MARRLLNKRGVFRVICSDGVVRGIFVHVADSSLLKKRELSAFIKKEIDTWGEVVRATGTKPGN